MELSTPISESIHIIRGQKVMLDEDLARLYGVQTKNLNKAVKRNEDRFPSDFMFQLSDQELTALRFQIGTSKNDRGGRRYAPYAFTEQGIAMLSSVLNSKQAIEVNIQIMRVFVKMRSLIAANQELAKRIDAIEKKIGQHDEEIGAVFQAINEMLLPPINTKKPRIGF